jgi:rubrerythrin
MTASSRTASPLRLSNRRTTRVAQMRALAEDVQDEQAKETMLRIAKDYDRLAKRAEERARGLRQSK